MDNKYSLVVKTLIYHNNGEELISEDLKVEELEGMDKEQVIQRFIKEVSSYNKRYEAEKIPSSTHHILGYGITQFEFMAEVNKLYYVELHKNGKEINSFEINSFEKTGLYEAFDDECELSYIEDLKEVI